MSAFLAYPYSSCLTLSEQVKIDKNVRSSRKEFMRGFKAGTEFSLKMYVFYLFLTIASASAAESPVKNGTVKAGAKKSVSKMIAETLVNVGIIASCTAVQCGEWYLGFTCGFLLIAIKLRMIDKSK